MTHQFAQGGTDAPLLPHAQRPRGLYTENIGAVGRNDMQHRHHADSPDRRDDKGLDRMAEKLFQGERRHKGADVQRAAQAEGILNKNNEDNE